MSPSITFNKEIKINLNFFLYFNTPEFNNVQQSLSTEILFQLIVKTFAVSYVTLNVLGFKVILPSIKQYLISTLAFLELLYQNYFINECTKKRKKVKSRSLGVTESLNKNIEFFERYKRSYILKKDKSIIYNPHIFIFQSFVI